MIRVVIAEDSATVRELLVAIFDADAGIQVVGQARTGREAVELARDLQPDLITMDVTMPEMDGLEATKAIMATAPTSIVIVSSAAHDDQVNLSLNALRAGALLVLPTPSDPHAPDFPELRRQLVEMAKAMADVRVVRRRDCGAHVARRARHRVSARAVPRAAALAASTGGPQALQRILAALPGDFPIPVIVVQHIARGFAKGLAEWLDTGSRVRVKLAEHGERMSAGTVYVSPDDRHVGFASPERLAVLDTAPIGGFRPSANHLFASMARHLRAEGAAVILTGMGQDGVAGLKELHETGGYVIAQDRVTSVVYGMPRVAMESGLVDAVLPLDDIAPRLLDLVYPPHLSESAAPRQLGSEGP